MKGLECMVEEAAISWLAELGWPHLPGPALAPDGQSPERANFRTVILEGRLRAALARINDHLPPEAVEWATQKVLRLDSPSVDENNYAFHRLVREGIAVHVKRAQGLRGDIAWLFDCERPENND